MLDAEVETRPWAEQLALDDESYRAQLAYLLERSPFYREKLAAGLDDAAGGLAEIARAAADREGRAPGDAHAGEPDRRAPLRGAVRDRPHLLDERHHRHAELHPADRAATSTTG